MSVEDTKRMIFDSISDLIEMEPVSKSDFMNWYDSAKRVKLLMELDKGDLQIPHALWHYLDDSDIRMKDRRYAEAQILQIKELLRAWVF